jgi:hypothetical protein
MDLTTNNIMVSRMRWARHVTWIKIRNTYKILTRKREVKRPLAGLSGFIEVEDFPDQVITLEWLCSTHNR